MSLRITSFRTPKALAAVTEALNRLIRESELLDRAVAAIEADIGGGTAAATRIEVDFGPLPTPEHTWTVTDPLVTPSSAVFARISSAAPTGKDPDEVGMDALQLSCEAGEGQVTFTLRGLDGWLADRFLIDYVPLGATV